MPLVLPHKEDLLHVPNVSLASTQPIRAAPARTALKARSRRAMDKRAAVHARLEPTLQKQDPTASNVQRASTQMREPNLVAPAQLGNTLLKVHKHANHVAQESTAKAQAHHATHVLPPSTQLKAQNLVPIVRMVSMRYQEPHIATNSAVGTMESGCRRTSAPTEVWASPAA